MISFFLMQTENSFECIECHQTFSSRTKLFKHLEVHGVAGKERTEKFVILVGYKVDSLLNVHESDVWVKDALLEHNWSSGSDDICGLIAKAIRKADSSVGDGSVSETKCSFKGWSRASSCAQRASYILGQEEGCHVSCEVFCMTHLKLLGRDAGDWIDSVNSFLPSTIRVLSRQNLPTAAGEFHVLTLYLYSVSHK